MLLSGMRRMASILLLLLPLSAALGAQSFTAKVVGVHDGDTITVYDGREQTRIRLEGIDCPETSADFSTRAKQLTSNLVFGKQVRVEGGDRQIRTPSRPRHR